MGRKNSLSLTPCLIVAFRIVYRAHCQRTKRIVALKQILIPNEDEGFPLAAIREIQSLQKLNYENIVRLIDMCRSSSSFDSTMNVH